MQLRCMLCSYQLKPLPCRSFVTTIILGTCCTYCDADCVPMHNCIIVNSYHWNTYTLSTLQGVCVYNSFVKLTIIVER